MFLSVYVNKIIFNYYLKKKKPFGVYKKIFSIILFISILSFSCYNMYKPSNFQFRQKSMFCHFYILRKVQKAILKVWFEENLKIK